MFSLKYGLYLRNDNRDAAEKLCVVLWKQKVRKDHLPILNIFVPQMEQIPVVAGLPFFIVTFFSSFIDLFDLHLTQYASIVVQAVGIK
jgi:hypothetical protein